MSVRLTGRARYRVKTRFLRSALIVLQVEEYIEGGSWRDPYDGEEMPPWDRLEWRDAHLGDITLGDLLPRKIPT